MSGEIQSAAGHDGGAISGVYTRFDTLYSRHLGQTRASLRTAPRTLPGRSANIVLIGSHHQESALAKVHERLGTLAGVRACSWLRPGFGSRADFPGPGDLARAMTELAPQEAEALQQVINHFVVDAAVNANAVLVVNMEAESDGTSPPESGGIRSEEYYGQIAPIRDRGQTPVLFMQRIPLDNEFAHLTHLNEGNWPPENVAGGCWKAIASLAVRGV